MTCLLALVACWNQLFCARRGAERSQLSRAMPRTCEKCEQLKAEGKIEKAKFASYGFPPENGEKAKATRCKEHAERMEG